ncbi:uncharacterized protein LOC120520263 [Polypterus senegalus]|uniref:uncharacterized protein LOC120520263 n=1 Tax=Polypterus senegalus TaxID=55291 RepID=UPI0019633678|nr:uncharacterized protein LOC120520263 [Polypterus senegalus]
MKPGACSSRFGYKAGKNPCLTNDSSICLKSIESDVISLSTADKENKDRVYGCVKKCFNSLCLPYGDGVDNLALYNTLGPYVKNISLRLVTEQLQIEKLFVLELSGYLASSLDQSTGIRDLNRTVFSLVKLALNWTSDDQFTYSVPVLPDGSFTASLSWVYTKSGTYQINASVMNLLSIQESHIEVTSLNPVPALLEVKVMQTPEQVPSCITFPVDRATSLEKVFLGELCIFNAFVSIGTHLKFHWHFTDNNITHILGGECSRMENCLSNTVVSLFCLIW